MALANSVRIYTLDTVRIKVVHTHEYFAQTMLDFTYLRQLRATDTDSANYSHTKKRDSNYIGRRLIASSDEGVVVLWDVNSLGTETVDLFREVYPLDEPPAAATSSRKSQIGRAKARLSRSSIKVRDSATCRAYVHPCTWQCIDFSMSLLDVCVTANLMIYDDL